MRTPLEMPVPPATLPPSADQAASRHAHRIASPRGHIAWPSVRACVCIALGLPLVGLVVVGLWALCVFGTCAQDPFDRWSMRLAIGFGVALHAWVLVVVFRESADRPERT